LDNIRKNDGEKKNDYNFAKQIAEGFDCYINNAFAVSHRNHASVSAITQFLPSYAGPLIESEMTNLQKAIDAPVKGKVVIMGGAKTETKVPVVKNFIDRAERIIIGGVIANDILTVRGYTLHASNVDPNSAELLAELDINDKRLILPVDFKYSPDNDKIWDIGPKSIETFAPYIESAKMIIWNGPVGLFENNQFEFGTKKLAQLIADSGAVKIIGGGDTIEAVDRFGLRSKFDFISTGGGAMLAFLAGEELPGLEALEHGK
jgi:phosphoglycerate kinase